MKKRKQKDNRITAIIIAAILIISISGCGSKNSSDSGSEQNQSVNYQGITTENKAATLSSSNAQNATSDSVDGGYNLPESLLDEDFNTEEYSQISENTYLSVKNYPLSTFSADVDTASYSNIRRMIQSGYQVTKDAVRIEEMINYFKYDYKQPENDAPFSVKTELADCPWNQDTKLLSIGIQAKDIDYSELPSSNLVFLLDVSGSMNSEYKLPLMVSAFKMLTENLRDEDRISIVTYAGYDTVLLEGVKGTDAMTIIEALESLQSGGSTHGSAGIETAYKIAEKYYIDGGNNRVILATDGDLNVGTTSEGELKKLVEAKRDKGVYLSVLGFGSGNIKDNKMETLAQNGNGNYYYIDSVLEARKVLVDEMGGTLFTVADDVKFQVEFNPSVVKGYRLIGYENRLLQSQDFEDDTKDAGEIGAGHRVTVLYEIVLNDSPIEIPETTLKYQDDSTYTESDEWLTVKIRYKDPGQSTSKLLEYPVGESEYSQNMPEDLAFASCVAAFGMLLRDSEFKGDATYQKIITTLSALPCVSKDEYKSQFLELVQTMNARSKK